MALEAARQRPLNEEVLRAQLGRLGGTEFELGDLECRIEGEVMLPVSELNRMRRALVDECSRVRQDVAEQPKTHALASAATFPLSPLPLLPSSSSQTHALASAATLHVLCRSFDQIDAALSSGVAELYVDFEDIRLYGDAVKRVRDHGAARIFLATPRTVLISPLWAMKR